MATFEELGLSEQVLSAVAQMGYTEATPVQEQAIPLILKGEDVIAAAQTGTGKTAAFVLPTFDTLPHYKRGRGPVCLIVTPTRELAQQIDTVARTVGRKTGHYVLTVVGGVSYNPQISGLRRGIDVLVATPGRLLDLYDRGNLQLDDIQVLVLDEADRMLDMGFWPDVKKIIECLPQERQTLLFSATIDDSVMRTIGAEVRDPKFVEIAHKGTAAETVQQFVIPVAQAQKNELLEAVLDKKGSDRVIVFTRTKARAEILAERLNREGFSAEAIHGDRSQGQRSRALKMFRDGRVGILVATDVLARGIDVSDVDHVINYDVPMDPEDYIHRIGRTGRAGEEGFAITFLTRDEMRDFHNIEFLMKRTVPELELDDFEFDDRRPELDPDRDPSERPSRGGRNGGRGGRGRGGRGGDRRDYNRDRDDHRSNNYRGSHDRHSDNRQRTDRQFERAERIAHDESTLTGEEVKPRTHAMSAEHAERIASRTERRAAKYGNPDDYRSDDDSRSNGRRNDRRDDYRDDRRDDRRGGQGGRGGSYRDDRRVGGQGGRRDDRNDSGRDNRRNNYRDDRNDSGRDNRRNNYRDDHKGKQDNRQNRYNEGDNRPGRGYRSERSNQSGKSHNGAKEYGMQRNGGKNGNH